MTKIKHNLTVKTPASKVFDAITKINNLQNWWTNDTSGDPNKGGQLRFSFGKDMIKTMKVTNIIPGKEIQWTCIEGPKEWMNTTISFWLTEDKNGYTQITFEHDGWKETSDFFGTCNYHWGWYLRSLKTWCETGKGTPHITEKEKQMQY